MRKPIASIDRPLTLRLRPDLVAVPVEMSGMTTWVVQDPLTLEHFQFSVEEHALLEWLRESVSISELARRFARRFAPQTISLEAIWDYLSRLHRAGLVVGQSPGQGSELLERMRREQRWRWAMAWTSLLSIRFRGFDPDAFITALHGRLRWLFSPATRALALVIIVFAASLVVAHFDEFRQRLPEASALFDPRNLVWLLLSIAAVKVLHEFGHALTCKHFGGEVRELGLMLLVFAPCLYCDVSDAWRLNNKWRRIAVSGAGIAVEILLAAVATIVWWHAQPGIIQLIALNTMVVCTVGTLLVNGNPLLRYDGYYILSDLVETPNLWQRSRDVLRRFLNDLLFASRAAGTGRRGDWSGPGASDDPLVPDTQRPWLALYAMASKMYVALVCIAIIWGLVQLLYPLHLQNLAYAIGFTAIAGALVGPVSGTIRLFRNPLRRSEIRAGRLAWIVSVGLAALVVLLSLPVSYYVRAPLVLLPDEAARVYATTGGRLVSASPAGRKVSRGEVIGQMMDPELERELVRLEGEHALRQLKVEHLERLRGTDTEANDELPTARAALADTKRRLEDRHRAVERLALRSPADGFVIAAPSVPQSSAVSNRLATWSGSLLEPVNLGAQLEPGTLVCLVGDPGRLTAVLLIDDAEVKRLQPGQRARLVIDQLPGEVIEGEVVDVARHEVREDASEGAARADLAALFAGIVPPGRTGALYQARVRLDAAAGLSETAYRKLVIGGRGHAKVAIERITLARSILRYFAQTFRLPM
ncbi:MAG TPA: HlyD family efflux transporter periplasmic adaptor subunit [Lacipirellulaceae bacterium]|nr:HlyD family efflux transporter periplasmic adaptor subunit [Lacipirellulaceae bacterium]